MKNVFSEVSQNSQETTCAWVFFNKSAGLRPAVLLKKRLWHRCFPVNFAKLPKILFLKEHLRWLLLKGNTWKKEAFGQINQADHSSFAYCIIGTFIDVCSEICRNQRCSIKTFFLKMLQYSQERTYVDVSL